jgi:hypothetical protein
MRPSGREANIRNFYKKIKHTDVYAVLNTQTNNNNNPLFSKQGGIMRRSCLAPLFTLGQYNY